MGRIPMAMKVRLERGRDKRKGRPRQSTTKIKKRIKGRLGFAAGVIKKVIAAEKGRVRESIALVTEGASAVSVLTELTAATRQRMGKSWSKRQTGHKIKRIERGVAAIKRVLGKRKRPRHDPMRSWAAGQTQELRKGKKLLRAYRKEAGK